MTWVSVVDCGPISGGEMCVGAGMSRAVRTKAVLVHLLVYVYDGIPEGRIEGLRYPV